MWASEPTKDETDLFFFLLLFPNNEKHNAGGNRAIQMDTKTQIF